MPGLSPRRRRGAPPFRTSGRLGPLPDVLGTDAAAARQSVIRAGCTPHRPCGPCGQGPRRPLDSSQTGAAPTTRVWNRGMMTYRLTDVRRPASTRTDQPRRAARGTVDEILLESLTAAVDWSAAELAEGQRCPSRHRPPPANRAGIRTEHLLALLQARTPASAPGISPAPDGSTSVVIDGDGPLARSIGLLLSDVAAGIEIGSEAADSRELALRDGDRCAAPGLVVLPGSRLLPAARGTRWRRYGVPVLPVLYTSTRMRVGPLVVPGGPCPECLDLHHQDQDPQWAALRFLRTDSDAPLDPAVATIGVGLVALLAGNLLRERRHLPGVSLEICSPEPRVVRQQWNIHPRCSCARRQDTMAT